MTLAARKQLRFLTANFSYVTDTWRCSCRPKGRKPCPAKVVECLISGAFERNGQQHNHNKLVHGKTKAVMLKECYENAIEHVFTPAGKIIDDIKRKYLHPKPLANCVNVSPTC